MRLVCAGLSDTGMVRDHNEDNFHLSPTEAFVVVADGMGGHLSGEVASKMAIDEIVDFYEKTINETEPIELPSNWPHRKRKPDSREERRLITGISRANETVFNAAQEKEEYHGMGTTMVSAYFIEEGVFIGHVGDSRAYRFRDGKIAQISQDHSLANEYIKMGILKPSDLSNFPYKNVITRAVGLQGVVEVETRFYEHEDGDIYLLCSDGLSDPVKVDEMEDILNRNSDDLPQACRELITTANKNGGMDNITVILAKTVY